MSSWVTEPRPEMSPLPGTVTVSRDALMPVTVMFPLPLRPSAVSDGTLTSTYIGALGIEAADVPDDQRPGFDLGRHMTEQVRVGVDDN